MKKVLCVLLILAVIMLMSGCDGILHPVAPKKGSSVELVMPGNTVVMGNLDEILWGTWGSNNWIKVTIDGKTYFTHEWRVVIKE